MTVDVHALLKHQPILLFDGECGFCNRSVLFVLKRERGRRLHFAALQSPQGMALKAYFDLDERTDSLILIKSHEAYIKSCAALRLTQYMKGLWPLLMIFILIPPFLRNPVYDWVARNRMRWFGRVRHCELLQQKDQARFLDGQ